MAVDITALYCCLDDFCKVFADWEAHRLLPSEQTRQRSGKLSRAEMLFIMVLFHLSPYKNFKVFYFYGIGWSISPRIPHPPRHRPRLWMGDTRRALLRRLVLAGPGRQDLVLWPLPLQ